MIARIVALAGLLAVVSTIGCATGSRVTGVITSDERRVWVVRVHKDYDDVYRCADGAGPDQPPKPVCVRATMVESP